MRDQDIQFFRNELLRELNNLTQKADIAAGELIDADTIHEADPLDRAMEEQARDRRLHFQNRDRKLIAKIQSCLDAIEEGEYGICQACEEPISIARLKARPVTSYCIACKTEQESYERMTGS